MDCTGLNRKISFKCSQYDRIQCLSISTPLIQLCGALEPLELLWPLSDVKAAKGQLMALVEFGIPPSFPLSLDSAVSLSP